MVHRHESAFFYAITRPYPFRWFTPTVIVGGVILTALFSTLNYYSNGFQLENKSTQNPQSIQTDFLKNLPTFLTNKIQPQCQPIEIPVEGTFFTNQTALRYKLDSVRQCDDNVTWIPSPSLRYYNNIFQGCSVTSLVITLEGRGQTPQQRAWNSWAPKASAFITCNISNTPDPIFRLTNPLSQARLSFTTEYSYVPPDVAVPPKGGPSSQGLFNMTYQDQKTRASMWWGSSLLSMFWVQVSERMTVAMANSKEKSPITNGAIYFTRNPDITDIMNLDFFSIDYRFYQDNSDGSTQVFQANDSTRNNFSPHNIATFDSRQTYPNIWVPADSFAKSFYSTILTDLGQITSRSNILADPKALAYFTSNASQIVADVPKAPSNAIPSPSPQSFTQGSSTTGPLNVTNANIVAQFICQEPAPRPGFDIFISILVQDLVMLNAIWRLYTLIVQTFLVTRKNAGPEHNHCQGCVSQYTGITDVIARADIDMSQPNAAGTIQRRSREKWQGNMAYQPVSLDDYTTEHTGDIGHAQPHKTAPYIHSNMGRIPKHL